MMELKKKMDLYLEGYMKEKELIRAIGGKSMKPARGILLYGAPGCGKSFFSKATAGEFNQRMGLKVLLVGIEVIKGQHWSVQLKKMEEVFQLAYQSAPCVIIWDEIEALASDPLKSKRKWDIEKSTLFKQKLDGASDLEKEIIHIGTTNYPWMLEGALLRPGRFSMTVHIPPPDKELRETLIRQRLIDMALEEEPDYEELIKWTKGNTISEILGYLDRVAEGVIQEIRESGKERLVRWEDFEREKDYLKRKGFSSWLKEAKYQLNQKDKEGMKDYFKDILEFEL